MIGRLPRPPGRSCQPASRPSLRVLDDENPVIDTRDTHKSSCFALAFVVLSVTSTIHDLLKSPRLRHTSAQALPQARVHVIAQRIAYNRKSQDNSRQREPWKNRQPRRYL